MAIKFAAKHDAKGAVAALSSPLRTAAAAGVETPERKEGVGASAETPASGNRCGPVRRRARAVAQTAQEEIRPYGHFPMPASLTPLTGFLSSDVFDCNACGACCSHSSAWPRFSTEADSELDRIPAEHISRDESGMRCEGARCSALVGKVGRSTSCSIYEIRPDVCRACVPGGSDCLMARQALGLPMLRPASA